MDISMTITDPTLLAYLERFEAEKRDEIALVALQIGMQALAQASGSLDANTLQHAAEHAVQAALDGMRETLNAHFSADSPDSALNRILHSIDELKTRKQSQRQTTQGGKAFEDMLGTVLAKLAAEAGDRYEATGEQEGSVSKAKVGDFVITLGEQSHAPGGAIVVEAKRSGSYTVPNILKECKASRDNRRAQVSLFVWDETYGREKNHPPLVRYDHDIVVLWNEENPETDLYVQAGYWLARGLCQRETSAQNPQYELARKHADKTIDAIVAIDDILTKIKKSGEDAVKKSQEVVTQTISVQGMLKGYVETLRTLALFQTMGERDGAGA